MEPTPDETYRVDRPERSDSRQLCWSAWGSMRVDRVRSVWESTGSLKDLIDVPGPWAVVLWDPATSCHIVLSDPVGVLPVFIATTRDGQKIVGSWLAALADREDVDDVADPTGILVSASVQLTSPLNDEMTRLRNVRAVPWGRAAFVDAAGSVRLEQYWHPERIQRNESLSAREAAHLLDEVIGAAVADLLPPVGTTVAAHVSGGLDCTTVALRVHGALQARGERVVRGYSWSPDEREVPRMVGDERALLDEVEATSGIPIWKRYSDESGDWLTLLDPTRYPNNTLQRERFVLPHAAAEGIEVIFSGWGGDELSSYNGRRVISTLIRSGKWAAVRAQGRARRRILEGSSLKSVSLPRRYGRYVLATLPDGASALRHPIDAISASRWQRGAERRLRAFSAAAADAFVDNRRRYGSVRSFHTMQMALLTSGHMPGRTSSWYQAGRVFGIIHRYPLLDVRVVECALSLPWQAYLSEGWDRTAFRMMADEYVPGSVAWNVTKVEPANYFAPVTYEPPRSTPVPETAFPDHPGVAEALALLETLRPPGLRTQHRNPQVVSRSDLRP